MKLVSKLLLIALVGVFVVGCTNNASSSVLDKDTLKVGMELEYPPFETIDANGKPTGFSVGFAEALGEYLGMKVEIVSMKYDALIPALESKKIDVIISSMTITEERLKQVNFSDEYARSDLYALLSNKSTIQTPEEINVKGVKIAVKLGTIAHTWALNNAPNATIQSFESIDAAVLDVANGNSEVVIYDPLSVYAFNQEYPQTRVLTTPLIGVSGWGIALPKNDQAFEDKVNAFIKESKSNGIIEQLKAKYLQEEIKKFKDLGLPFFID